MYTVGAYQDSKVLYLEDNMLMIHNEREVFPPNHRKQTSQSGACECLQIEVVSSTHRPYLNVHVCYIPLGRLGENTLKLRKHVQYTHKHGLL